MNGLQVFRNSEFGELGILTIEGREYFPATACARLLGYINPRDAIKRHCKTEGVVKHDAWVQTGTKADGTPAMRETSANYINEGNLYRLIVHSNLPAAEKFERWVFDEVLPTIRRQGAYVPDINTLIAQTVQATVAEVVKQLIPAITQAAQPPALISVCVPKRRRMSIIGTLDVELREEMEDMILSNRWTYADISAHFSDHYGIQVSRSSVHRYAKQLCENQGMLSMRSVSGRI